jgi:hypothetical protein
LKAFFRAETGAKTKRFYLFRPDSAEKRGKGGAAVKFGKKRRCFLQKKDDFNHHTMVLKIVF